MNGQSLAEFIGTGNDCERWFSLRAAPQCAIAIVLAATLQVSAFPQSSNSKEIPFENSRLFGLVLVRVEVNGRPAVLIVDTASNHTIVRSGFAGAGVFTRATLKVGPSPGAITSGLLGTDLFSKFELVVVDLKNHKLILDP